VLVLPRTSWFQKIYNLIGTNLTKCILKADVVAVTISKYVDALGEKYKSENDH
jgi:hypothetical protein